MVYGGIGRAARNWACFDKIIEVCMSLVHMQVVFTPFVRSSREFF